jgi:hypothetical protein
VLNLKGLEKAEKGNAKMENASEAMMPAEQLMTKGFGEIAIDPSSRQTTGILRSRFIRGEEVADKGSAPFSAALKDKNSITRKVLAVNVYLVCNSNDCERY